MTQVLPRSLRLFEISRFKLLRRINTIKLKGEKDKFIIKSSLPDIFVPDVRVSDLLWENISSFRKHIAIECAETQKSYTYEQLHRGMAIFATALHKKLGLQVGDVVGVMAANCPEFTLAVIGAVQAGCAVTTFNPIYKKYEIYHQAKVARPKLLITTTECYEVVLNGLKMSEISARIVIIDDPKKSIPDGTIRFSELVKDEPDYSLLDSIERKPDDIVFIPFSSGTTGLPKGVNITVRNLLASLVTMSVKNNCYTRLTDGDIQDVLPCVLPFYHIYGLIITMFGHFRCGAKLITIPKFSAQLYIDVLKKHKPTLLYVVPPMAILLGKHPDVTAEHLHNVRFLICGAAPLAATDAQAVIEKAHTNTSFKFCQGYGSTESCSLTTATMIDADVVDFSSSGEPMASVELKFVDPSTGDAIPVGEQGELYVRGPTVMKGYHRNLRATLDSLTKDGFFKTGDIGYYKPGVGLFITDRKKELIKVKGLQVAPAELEGLLRTHPAVEEAAVIGVPHEFFGEIPKAFVIQKKGQKITAEELQDFVASKVAPFKKIKEVVFVDNIPKTNSGKILKRELKQLYA